MTCQLILLISELHRFSIQTFRSTSWDPCLDLKWFYLQLHLKMKNSKVSRCLNITLNSANHLYRKHVEFRWDKVIWIWRYPSLLLTSQKKIRSQYIYSLDCGSIAPTITLNLYNFGLEDIYIIWEKTRWRVTCCKGWIWNERLKTGNDLQNVISFVLKT